MCLVVIYWMIKVKWKDSTPGSCLNDASIREEVCRSHLGARESGYSGSEELFERNQRSGGDLWRCVDSFSKTWINARVSSLDSCNETRRGLRSARGTLGKSVVKELYS